MSPQNFIFQIRKAYIKAGRPVIKSVRIKRGTNHTISSIAEDIFAKYVEDKISKTREVWVDPQITVKSLKNGSGKRALLFRPDVCVYNPKERVIEKIFDLKMDLGYKRKEFVKQARKNAVLLNRITQRKAKCKLNGGYDLTFLPGLECNFIVISDRNISKSDYKKVESYFRKTKREKLFTLIKGHLNHIEKGFEIRKNDFKRLDYEIEE